MPLPAGAPPNTRASQLDVPEDVRAWVMASKDFKRPDNPASWIADEATWDKAKAAVEPYWDHYDDPYAVVVTVYRSMGGTIAGKHEASRPIAPVLFEAPNGTHFAPAVVIALDAAPAQGSATAADPTGPRWVQVAAEGKYAKNGQEFTLTRAVFEQIQANFRARKSFHRGADGWGDADVVPFDWRHASEMPPTVPNAFATQQALGWARDLDVRSGPDGKAQLWALATFQPDVAEAIRANRVKWTSIAVWPNATDPHGKPIGWDMSSIALTNDPHIQGMVPLGQGKFGRGDDAAPIPDPTSAAPAAPTPSPARRPIMDENLKALLIALGRYFNCAPTVEAIGHQAPITFEKVGKLEKDAEAEPGRVAFMKKLLADDGDGDGANAKDFDDVMKKVHGRMMARKSAADAAEAEKAQLAKDRDGLLAELQSMYGGEVKDEEDRVGKDAKAVMDRHGLDPAKDQQAAIAATGLLFERTGGVMPPAEPPATATFEQRRAYFDATKAFLAARRTSSEAFVKKYPAPSAAPGQATPATAPHLFTRYYGEQPGAAPAPASGLPPFMRAGAPAAAPIALGNGGRALTAGPQPAPEQGGLDFAKFMACAGSNEFDKAVSYVRSMDPANAKLDRATLFNLARPIAHQAREIAAAQGIQL